MKDSAGQKLAYVYFEDEPGRRSAAKLFTKDEAQRIAARVKAHTRYSVEVNRSDIPFGDHPLGRARAVHLVLNTLVDDFGALIER